MAELGFINDGNERKSRSRIRRASWRSAGTGSVNYVADWVMDVLNDVLGHVDEDIVVAPRSIRHCRPRAEKALVEELAQKGDKVGVSQGALVAMTPDGAVRAHGRRHAIMPKASSTARSPPSASPARRSSRSSISPRWSTG